MAPSRRKGGGKAAAVAAACRQWKVGDLVLAKVKGFPAWPAAVSEPEKWGYSTDWKKVLVHFFGTQQIAFCNPADVEAFTEEKKQSLLTKRHAKGSDFVRAVKEITESYEKLKQQEQAGDPKSIEEATLDSDRNTTLLPRVSENPTGTSLIQMKSDPSHCRDESTLLNEDEDASAAEQMLALRDNSLPCNKACDSALLKEPRKIATYSSKRRNRGARSQKCAPLKKTCLVQRSKNSPRLQSDKVQSSMLQYSDGGQSIDDVEDGALRRRKRIRRSSGQSESDDVASSALKNGSDEDNASEIATVESNNNTRNEGNGVDSGSKVEKIDAGGQFLKGNNELHFQINTMVKRKKRKPTRKRGTCDVIDPPAKVVAEALLEAGAWDNVHTSNGDEHLPLVKRARVRMSRAFYGNPEPNGSSQVEERSSKDTLASATAQTSPSEIISSHDTIPVEESKFFEVSPKLSGEMVIVVPSPVEKLFDEMSPSEACVQIVEQREHAMGCNELSKEPGDKAAQSIQVSSFPAGEPQTASVPEAVCFGDSQPMQLPTSESDLPVVQCCQVAKSEISLGPNSVDSPANEASGMICPSSIPSQLSGQHRSQDQDACSLLYNSHEFLNEEGNNNDACMAQVVHFESIHSPSTCLVVNKQETENVQTAKDMLLKKEQGSLGEEHAIVKPAQTTPNLPISATENDVVVDESEPLNETGYIRCEDAVEDRKQLKMTGEDDDQKQQVQTDSSVSLSVSENLSREKMSLSPANIADTPAGGTPHSISTNHISTAESVNNMQNNSSCSPKVQSGEKKIVCDSLVKEEEKIVKGVCQRQKVVSYDVQSTRESFEDALSSLVRTKESIGRATRLAMDLMKFGVSAKAMEILAHTLESESNLMRRVDLFFLVDSIAQCSKGLKGDTGCVYLSAIQVILPRLLSAAVPAGATTQENRKQCLKVLRLWLERRILPESIVRQHIRELDFHSIAPADLYSRRSARTERSLDDPVRDMEDMLVDEYGSNSTLQLPGFCMPAMLNDSEGRSESEAGSDSDGEDFESVTPEHESRIFEENISCSIAERHTLILEDVDGELEMEDVAPPWEIGNCAPTDQAANTRATNCQSGQHYQPVFSTSHQHVSLSSPPLPSSSPPPPPLPPAPPLQQAQCAVSDSYLNGSENGGHPNMHGDHQAGPSRMNLPLSGNTMHYQGPESSYSSGVQLTNCNPHADRAYPSHPPPPPPPQLQHQYSFSEPGHHVKSRRDAPLYSHRSHYVPNFDETKFHDNHERKRYAPYENRDNWRYPPSTSYGSRYEDEHKGPYPSSSYNGGPPRESGRFQNNRWNHPPRPYNNRHSFHPKPHSEGPVPVGMRDPGMWHQRSD